MSASSLNNKNIVLCICGGIAAYKSPMIVRGLRAAGAHVQVVLSSNAHHFVTPTTLQALAANPVRQDLWDKAAEAAMGHIELARWADLVIIAPATANTMAKLARGMADDLLTTLCLATAAPVMIAPAMNQQMYAHPASVANLQQLRNFGHTIIGPDSGDQACGDVGMGRMSEPDQIVEAAAIQLNNLATTDHTSSGVLTGRTVLITTGPTLEAIDPVRYISNHSSGKQGISMAQAALAQGAHVILIAGPNVPATDANIRRIDVISALDMQHAIHQHLSDIDLFIGVAAVADYRPAEASQQKIKRAGNVDAGMQLELVENPDIIAGVAKATNASIRQGQRAIIIGFAAETNNALEHARAKLKRKGLDAIVLNDVSDPSIGFNSDDNAATLIHADGEISFARQPKSKLASALIEQICTIFGPQLADTNPDSG